MTKNGFSFGHRWPYAAKHMDVLERGLRLPKFDRLLVIIKC